MARELKPAPGLKYYGVDRDLWHMVSKVTDGDVVLWVSKSWNKWMAGWTYNILSENSITWILSHQNELHEKN
jgi:hypothetical protein